MAEPRLVGERDQAHQSYKSYRQPWLSRRRKVKHSANEGQHGAANMIPWRERLKPGRHGLQFGSGDFGETGGGGIRSVMVRLELVARVKMALERGVGWKR